LTGALVRRRETSRIRWLFAPAALAFTSFFITDAALA